MADFEKISQIYDLRIVGYDDSIQKVNTLNSAWAESLRLKRELNRTRLTNQDSQALAEAKRQTADLILQQEALRAQRLQATNEAKAAAIARQQQINQQNQIIAGNVAEAGSYRDTLAQYRELYKATTNKSATSTVDFRGSTLTYDQAIAKLKELSAVEQAFRRQFARDATLVGEYTTGIIQAFQRMGVGDLVTAQANKATSKLNELNAAFERTKAELISLRAQGAGGLDRLEAELVANRQEAIALQNSLNQINNSLRGVGDIGTQVTNALQRGFQNIVKQAGQIIITYFGVQAAIQGVISSVETTKALADQTTNLEIELDKAAGGADKLVSSIAKLNTRTKLLVLEEIANVAARAGVSEQNLLGVTEALDKIKIAFGKDFGNVEEGTESLVKLVNIFEGTDAVTGENLLKVGNAVRTLANESVASVPFLNDFSKRMAGLKGVADISLPAVLGLASGFEQFGQSSEVAGTALTKVIPKLATDTAKYGEIAGLTQKAFSDLLKNNPAEALIRVAEGLTKSKTGIEEISTSFADSELGTGRITAILATLGSKSDEFRKSIESAGKAYTDTGAITDAFNAKNNNLAATLDKISKKFADSANSEGFRLTLTAIAAIITILIGNIPLLVGVATVLAATWAINNRELLLLRLQSLAYSAGILAQQVALAILTAAQGAYNAVLFISNGAITLVNRALAAFNITLRASSGPLGIILTLLALLAAAYISFGRSLNSARDGLLANIRAQQALADVNKRAADSFAESKARLDSWILVVRSSASSSDTLKRAVGELININKEFSNVLKDGVLDLNELERAYQRVTQSIRLQSQVQAAASLSAEKQKAVIQVSALRQKLEIEFAQGKGGAREIGGLTDEEKALILAGSDPGKSSLRDNGADGIDFLASDFKNILDNLKKKEEAALTTYTDYLKIQSEKQAELLKLEDDQQKKNQAAAAALSSTFEVDIAALKAKIDALDKQIEVFQGAKADLDRLVKSRADLQAQLDKLLGNGARGGTSYKGAKLTGDQRDALKDIDAERDAQIASAKLLREQLNKEYGFRVQDEVDYLQKVQNFNIIAIDRKLQIVKNGNAEERKQHAELLLDRINQEDIANQKIFDLREKEYKEQRDQTIRDAQEKNAVAQDQPQATASERVAAKLAQDQAILQAQLLFANQLDNLEKQLGARSLKNTIEVADAVFKVRQDILKDQRELALAALKDAESAGAASVSEFKAIISAQRLAILESGRSPSRTANNLAVLDQEETVGILAREVASMRVQLPVYQQLLAQKSITDKEYTDFITALTNKQQDLLNAQNNTLADGVNRIKSLKDVIQTGLLDILNLKPESEGGKLFAEALNATYALAQQAQQAYFDSEQANIRKSLEAQEKRLELDKNRVKARAQSAAEEAAIDRDYQSKKEELERAAAVKIKNSKRAEAKLSLVTELANIAVSASNPAANIATFGAYSGIYYGIQAGLALGRYALRVNEINREQFAFGGRPGEVPTRGGRFGGRPHSAGGTDFSYNGQQYNAEVNELAIIRTRNAPPGQFSLTGTHAQIASGLNVIGGGINFEPGAHMRRFEYGGNLGESLQAPVFRASSITNINTVSQEDSRKTLDAVVSLAGAIQATSDRIDRFEVVQTTQSVDDALKKRVRQQSIGTL